MLSVGIAEELFVKEAGGFIVEFFEAGNFATFFVCFGVERFFDNGDSGAVGEFFDGVGEGEVFVIHEEGDGVARFSASEAFVVLLGRVDVE